MVIKVIDFYSLLLISDLTLGFVTAAHHYRLANHAEQHLQPLRR
jgi:hypothetical protein